MLYGILDLYNKSVKMALKHEFVDMAKRYASSAVSHDERKALWIKIAKHELSKVDDNRKAQVGI